MPLRAAQSAKELAQLVRARSEDLPDPDAGDAFAVFFDPFADARIVLLGESTRGTAELPRARRSRDVSLSVTAFAFWQ